MNGATSLKFHKHRKEWVRKGQKETDKLYEFILVVVKLSPLNISPRVRSDVTPRVTLAGIASGLIQNDIQDITTINADGMYVWNRW